MIWKIANNAIRLVVNIKLVRLILWTLNKVQLLLIFLDSLIVKGLWILSLLVFPLKIPVKKILTVLERICVHKLAGCQRPKYPIHRTNTALTCVKGPVSKTSCSTFISRATHHSGVEAVQRICWPSVGRTTASSINSPYSTRSIPSPVKISLTSPGVQYKKKHQSWTLQKSEDSSYTSRYFK